MKIRLNINPPTGTAQEHKVKVAHGRPMFYDPPKVREAKRVLESALFVHVPLSPMEGPLALTVSGFRIFGLSFGFMGFGIFASGFFTALNDGLTSALISFLRTLVFQSASILLLPKLLDIDGIWISVVAAEFMSVILGGGFLIGKRKKYHY